MLTHRTPLPLKPHRRRRRGAAAVEFSMLASTLIALLTGMMDYGWYMFHQSALDSAATIGCRAGALIDPGEADANLADLLTTTEGALEAALVSYGTGECDGACTVSVDTTGERPGRSLLCVVTRDVNPLVGLVASPLTLQSRVAVRLEWQRDE